MRAVDSAMALAVHLNRSLHVVWVMNDKLNCRFDDLFSVPSGIRISHMKSSGRISRNLLRVRRAYYRFSGLYINQKSLEELIQTKPGFSSFSKYRTVFILGHIGFFPNKYPFKALFPIKRLQDKIDSYECDSLIGVHIRRTDNKRSIHHSPTSKFISLMRKEIERDDSIRFFLSTDSTEEETTVREEFPERIISHNKKGVDRKNPGHVQDALIDLYCLSNCKKLIGSYWSSFSDTASRIRGVDTIIVNNQEQVRKGVII